MYLIFVYGTLKRGFWNHSLLEHSAFIGKARTGREFTLKVNGLPYLIEEEGIGASGELYAVSKMTLKSLDKLEGHPGFYQRKKIQVIDSNGKKQKVFAYIYPLSRLDNYGKIVMSKALVIEDYKDMRCNN